MSNISTEGRIEDFPTFLRQEFGKKQGAKYEERILKLSIDVAWHLDKLYGLVLDELGLDFAIDETGRIWMHEANNGPQTAFHEEKRAVNTIAYAKYIAKNGVMYTDANTKAAITKGQFQANRTNLPIATIDNRPCVGMLVGKHTNDPLTVALVNIAKEKNVQFYYFTPKDIDFDRGLIKASFYEDNEWVPKVAEYPDVIIDRLKMRGKNEAQFLYEELEDIPFTNEWQVHSKTRSDIYESLLTNDEIINILPDFQKVIKPRHVFQFLEKYKNVLLKPKNMALANKSYAIKQLSNNTYLVSTEKISKEYHEVQLRHLIKELIDKHVFIVQQDTRITMENDDVPEIHIHLMKDENNEWSFVSKYVKSEKYTDDGLIEIAQEVLFTYIKKIYGTHNVEIIYENIKNLSFKISSTLEEGENIPISEVAFVFSVDHEQNLKLLEVDPNGPKTVYDETQFAKSLISYAKSLATEKEEIYT